MSDEFEVVIDDFRGHPIFTIRKDGVPKFRFGRSKAETLLENWNRVAEFAETGNGNREYKGYDVLQLSMENDRFFRFGQWKASLCARFENDIRAFVAQFDTSGRNSDDGETKKGATRSSPTRQPGDSDDVADKCLLLALHVAFADQRVLEIEVKEIRQRLDKHLRQDSQQQLNELLRNVRGGKANLEEVVGKLNSELNSAEKKLLLEQLFEIAAADGLFHDQEEKVLTIVHERFGTPDDHFRRLLRFCSIVPYSNSTDESECRKNQENSGKGAKERSGKERRSRRRGAAQDSSRGDALVRLQELLEPEGSL
jgi:uncharacterized tellurite resistance protein B-like protein